MIGINWQWSHDYFIDTNTIYNYGKHILWYELSSEKGEGSAYTTGRNCKVRRRSNLFPHVPNHPNFGNIQFSPTVHNLESHDIKSLTRLTEGHTFSRTNITFYSDLKSCGQLNVHYGNGSWLQSNVHYAECSHMQILPFCTLSKFTSSRLMPC